eukprot:GEMP01047900.1.p1 GENE.GEMP01047900.1~~GEMP01047900.1.p1  ORF type:complete len:280 (+),score=30.68 GEMP01047900.1:92-931(+)
MNKPKLNLKSIWKDHHEVISVWGPFASAVVVVYCFFSDGDFSFLLTLSSLVNMFSFLMVVIKIETGRTCKGVSLKMMECYLALTGARLIAIVPFEGYLPFDRSGDWLYQVVESASFCLVGSIVYLCRKRYHSTYDAERDHLNHFFLIIPAALLAMIFHPALNDWIPSDICWAFALYVESMASLPQLFMFQREGREGQPVTAWTAHFLAAQACSKISSFIFWGVSFSELGDKGGGHREYIGHWVVVVQLVQLIVMGDFIYNYVQCLRKGIPVSELLAEHV